MAKNNKIRVVGRNGVAVVFNEKDVAAIKLPRVDIGGTFQQLIIGPQKSRK